MKDKIRYRALIKFMYEYWQKTGDLTDLGDFVFLSSNSTAHLITLTKVECEELSKFSEEYSQIKEKIISLLINWTWERVGVLEKIILSYFTFKIIHDKKNKPLYVDIAVKISKNYCKEDTFRIINGILDKVEK